MHEASIIIDKIWQKLAVCSLLLDKLTFCMLSSNSTGWGKQQWERDGRGDSSGWTYRVPRRSSRPVRTKLHGTCIWTVLCSIVPPFQRPSWVGVVAQMTPHQFQLFRRITVNLLIPLMSFFLFIYQATYWLQHVTNTFKFRVQSWIHLHKVCSETCDIRICVCCTVTVI